MLCVDDFSTGVVDNIAPLLRRADFRLVHHDITQPIALEERPAAVFHLASPASPPVYFRRTVETLEVGSAGTRSALEVARAAGALFVFASTSEVYGNPEVSPQPETYNGNVDCTGPRSVYDEAKRYGEALVMAYHRRYGLPTRIARIFNTYGPRVQADDGRVISNFIVQALTAQPLTVFGDGSQTRSFCYVTDLIDGILALAARDYVDPVNLGNPDERTILELARLVQSLTGTDAPIAYAPGYADDPLRRCPDISRARGILAWEPTVTLEDGLDETIRWFRDRLG